MKLGYYFLASIALCVFIALALSLKIFNNRNDIAELQEKLIEIGNLQIETAQLIMQQDEKPPLINDVVQGLDKVKAAHTVAEDQLQQYILKQDALHEQITTYKFNHAHLLSDQSAKHASLISSIEYVEKRWPYYKSNTLLAIQEYNLIVSVFPGDVLAPLIGHTPFQYDGSGENNP